MSHGMEFWDEPKQPSEPPAWVVLFLFLTVGFFVYLILIFLHTAFYGDQ